MGIKHVLTGVPKEKLPATEWNKDHEITSNVETAYDMGVIIGGTDEQTTANTDLYLCSNRYTRLGQKKTITNKAVKKLTFNLKKGGSPTGDVNYTIRKSSDNSIILEETLCNASELTISWIEYELTFPTMIMLNEEVLISVEFSGTPADNCVFAKCNYGDVKPDEMLSHVYGGERTDDPAWDMYYKLEYANQRFAREFY